MFETQPEGAPSAAADARSKPKPDPAIAIYAAYPKKVARPKALAAIRKALVSIKDKPDPADFLLERTTTYAAAVATWPEPERRFIPHPATWFNEERYHDDPRTWQRIAVQAGTSKQADRDARRADKARREYSDVPDAPTITFESD